MYSAGLVKYAGALLALATCSACAAPTVAPSSAALNGGYAGETTAAVTRNLSALPRHPSIVPDRIAKSKYYEYVINDYGSYATIFDYPNSDKQIGTIHDGVGGQGCTNVLYGYGKQTFWIVAGAHQISEYSVPQKLLKNLSVSVGMPSSCAMNTSGDLAVGILYGTGGGDVVIFKNATGKGTAIPSSLAREYFDGYDNNGNLFFDGLTYGSNFELLEIPNGTTKVETITTSNTVKFPGSVQWDGTYLTVTDQRADAMYRYTVKGTKATLKGTVSLSGVGDCAQTWIATGIVYCGDAVNGDGEVFKYPAGGSRIATLTGKFDFPLGVVAAER
jgi:hypothetical protein